METAVMVNVSKAEAEERAEKERKEGKKVRLVPLRHGKYAVYVEE
jgi:hypothetical protein